jgi:hypothetical protein
MATNNSVNAPFPLSPTQGGTGATTLTQNGIVIGGGTSAATSQVLTDGQLLIGSTGLAPVATTITAGAGIAVTNAAGSITIAATGGAAWTVVTAASQTMAPGQAYIANNAGLLTFTLPTTASVGTEIAVSGFGAGGWLIAQNAGQTIHFGNTDTTAGAGGSLASTNRYDQIDLLCVVADSEWVVLTAVGNLTVV